MAPRRAAAVSAASSISQAAGPSTTASSNTSKNAFNQPRHSSSVQQLSSVVSTNVPPIMRMIPVQPLSPIIARLRKMWKFAAVCQFLFTFDEAFGMSGFETEALEKDLDGSEKKVIPDLMRRLLYTLTLNKSIDEFNWEDHLRAQYLARHPEESLLGTVEEPFPWSGLPLWQKVETLHQACEWQLWDAERFRKLVKNEEDSHIWRIDPIGWDSKDNTYWLFDDNRLWIQYPRPAPILAKAPPKKNSKKAKLEAVAAKRAAQKNQQQSHAQKRRREEVKPKSTPTRASARNRVESAVIESPANKRGKSSRRSAAAKDGWEEIPPELLYEEEISGFVKEDDEESDLSDPPPADEDDISMVDDVKQEEASNKSLAEDISMDVKEEEDRRNANGIKEDEAKRESNEKEEGTQADAIGQIEKKEPVDDWIEFETIAVTKQDWEIMAVQFAKSKHPDEKSLHQLLKTEILPKVMADLEEAEKQRLHEAAMANRKRSSRIALKESEREEKERDRIARLKMEEKMAAIRADEDEKRHREKEEEVALKKRDDRIREREDRTATREREAMERAEKEILERENKERLREVRKLKREQLIANGGIIIESEELQQSKADDVDSWELNCEVCGAAGINPDDNAEIVCCETCGRWQHTECWNDFDRKVGRPMRDWEKEDFFCSTCKPPGPGQPWPRPAIKEDLNATNALKESARTPLTSSSLSSPQSVAQPVAFHHYQQQQQQQQHQRPTSMPGMPFHPAIQGNYNTRPSMSSQNGQPHQWSQQQQQHHHFQQSPQSNYPHQTPQQPQPHPYYSMQPMQPTQQRMQYPQQQMPQSNYPQSPTDPQNYPLQLTQQQAQQMQYMQSQRASYSPSQHPYSNGHSYAASPAPSAQIIPQHMQRPFSAQSPVPVWPNSSDRADSHTTFNDSRRDMHAPPPTNHSQSIRPMGTLPSPRAALHSPSQSAVSLPNSQLLIAPPARSVAALPKAPASAASPSPSAAASPRPRAPIASSPMTASLLPSTASPSQTNATLPGPHASTSAPARPAPMLSNPMTSAPRPIQAASGPQVTSVNNRLASAISSLSSPQAPTVSSTTAPMSPSSNRSPTPSPKATSNVPRNIANLPSGSFPLRRNSTAKSPLSRPEGYISPSIPKINLGPTIDRAISPSPVNRSTNTKVDPLYNRQTVLSTASTNAASEEPGSSSGSLARLLPSGAQLQTTPSSSQAMPNSLPSQQQAAPQQPHKILGPSPPRPIFGASIISPTNATSSTPNTSMVTPSASQQISSQQFNLPESHQGNPQS